MYGDQLLKNILKMKNTMPRLSILKAFRNSDGVKIASTGIAPMIVPTTTRFDPSVLNALTSINSELSLVNSFMLALLLKWW